MKTVINIKTDKEVKKNAKKIAEDLGFSLSAVINAYLKQFVRNKEIYFSVIPQMSSGLEKIIGEIETDIRKKRNISQVFSSGNELKKHLSSL
jgi:addiction module RelB/DinJ family antitoxin